MRSKHLICLMILTAGLLSTACTPQQGYSRFEHIPSTDWEKADTIDFLIPPVAESGTYQEALHLRINTSFPFQSLTVEVIETVYPENSRKRYVRNCPLIDKNGNIKGAGVSLFQYTYPLGDIQLNRGDSVRIAVTHCMAREIMNGVTDVGISLTKR